MQNRAAENRAGTKEAVPAPEEPVLCRRAGVLHVANGPQREGLRAQVQVNSGKRMGVNVETARGSSPTLTLICRVARDKPFSLSMPVFHA